MPFRRSSLCGPVWTSEGRAKLSPRQHERVDVVLRMSCKLYNAILESWRGQWKWYQRDHQYDGVELSDVYGPGLIAGDRGALYTQFSEYRQIEQLDPKGDGLLWSDLAVQIGRGVVDRFDKARSSFYNRCKAKREGKKIKAGYPRFKSAQRWKTIEIPAPGKGMVKRPSDGGKWWKLHVKGLGVIKFLPYDSEKLLYELEAGGRVQEIRVVVKPLRTEVHLVVRTVASVPEAPDHPEKAVGVDLGISKRVAFSNGFAVDGITEDREEVKKRQRALSKHDNRHRKAKTDRYTPGRKRKVGSLQKAHARSKARERHSLHRLVHRIITMCLEGDVGGISAELLQIKNMMKNHKMADRIQQQRWGMLLKMLEIKAARAGIKFVQVDPRHTSLECSSCRHRKPKADLPLSLRVYDCSNCELVIDRDVNAAINVLIRGFGERFRVEGGDYSPSVWSEHVPITGTPSGTTSDGNFNDSESSREALPEEPQTKPYTSINPGI